jgi:hypothetical protein
MGWLTHVAATVIGVLIGSWLYERFLRPRVQIKLKMMSDEEVTRRVHEAIAYAHEQASLSDPH